MSCKKCGTGTKTCGCKDTAYTTPIVTTCLPACPPRCSEYMSASCIVLSDGINDIGIQPGETLESILQRIALILTNPTCVEYAGGVGTGVGNELPFAGNGIVEVGLDVPTNIFVTPIVPITAPGGNLNLSLLDQPANTIFAGPASGPDDLPEFRSLVIDDLPSLTTGSSVLMGDGAGKFTNVTIGPKLTFSGGILNAEVDVVIGADNGLSKNPSNDDEVWLGGTLLQNTVIDGDVNAYSFTLSSLNSFTVETGSSIYFKTEFSTDKTELFYSQNTAVFEYTNSSSAIETAYSGISGIDAFLGINTAYGDAYISIEKGGSDNEVRVHTPKINAGTATVNQVLTLKSTTGEAEWESVIAAISAAEGLTINPSNPNETLLGGDISTPATFTQDRYIDNAGYLLKFSSTAGATQLLELENNFNSSTCLTISQIAGDLLGQAINITSDGLGLAVSTETTAFEMTQKGNASYLSTVNDTNGTREVLNIRSPYLSSLPVVGYGAQLSFTLNNLTTAGSLQSSSYITSAYTNVSTGTGATKLSLGTKNTSDSNPVTNLELLGTGQLVLNKYLSTSSFAGTAVGLLGFDASGNIITESASGVTVSASEGLSIGATPGQVELGKTTLSAGADVTGDRFINTGIYDINLSGSQSAVGGSVLSVSNTSVTTNATAVRASTTGTSGYGVYSTASSATAVYGTTSTGTGVQGVSNSSAGVVATSNTGIALQSTSLGNVSASFTRNQANNVVEDVIKLVKMTNSAPAIGIGAAIKVAIDDDSGSPNTAGSLSYEYTDITSATRSAYFKLNVVTAGTESPMLEVGDLQTIRFPKNLPGPYADDTAASGAGVPQFALYRDASSNVKICQI